MSARMAGPAYTRLDVDERRRRLLELGADLFTRLAYDELSMAKIAKEAGISKALLYHYFPSKEAYFVATLEEKAEELAAAHGAGRVAAAAGAALELARRLPGLDRGEREQLRQDDPLRRGGARGAGDARPRARRRPRSGSSTGCAGTSRPRRSLRTAVRGWLGFMDGACLDWVAHRDLDRQTLHGLLLATLLGAVLAAEADDDDCYGEVMLSMSTTKTSVASGRDRARAVRARSRGPAG